MQPVITTIGRISLWSGRIAALLVLPLVLAMVYEVLSRYLFDAPTQWAFEVSYMMMGTIFLLGLSYALSVNQHVHVDFIHQRLPKRAIAVIDTLGYIALTGLLVWLTYTLFNNMLRVYNTGEGSGLSAWNPKVWPYRLVYMIGFGLFALQAFAKILENLLIILGHESGGDAHG
ncbi:TRAP transporter small permease subunit [Acuticoccus kandeliae]|uniref:TRAP transporter small permease subunit n=1 Tax=Acuticoccus kandeliae TaxID=2073160 RepID=UPI000D3E8758|nr:TRAP transporter small permease subunit [Acuticoccus kandeliae]